MEERADASRKIAILAENFTLGTPAQQILDRFLIGYPRRGAFRRPPAGRAIAAAAPAGAGREPLERRAADHGLSIAAEPAAALAGAGAAILVPAAPGTPGADPFLLEAIEMAARGARLYIYGAPGSGGAPARRLRDRAEAKGIALLAGTFMPAAWRLPPVDVDPDTALEEALIIVPAGAGEAELLGIDGLLPVIERRRGGESGVARVRALAGPEVWEEYRPGKSSWDLLAAAVSRSDTPQGNALLDGRTEDLAGLGLIPKLARNPLAYAIEHRDGLMAHLLAVEGVIADIDFAARAAGGRTVSAQIYRPPAPNAHQFSALAAVIEDFLAGGEPPWPLERSLLSAGLLDACRRARARPGQPLDTPELATAYSAPERSAFARE